MQERVIGEIVPKERGRLLFRLTDGTEFTLYRGELRRLPPQEQNIFEEGGRIPEELYEKLLSECIGVRAKKRALFLLEQRDRTSYQLREKLERGGYPQECVEQALRYVEQYHYLDDDRYARHYIQYHQQKKSRQRLKLELLQKGVPRETTERALAEVFFSDEREKIGALLKRRGYDAEHADRREQRRTYQFLLRRGFRCEDILAVMRCGISEGDVMSV